MIYLILIILFNSSIAAKISENKIDFEDVLKNEKMTDSERIIDLKIQLSRQEDRINNLQSTIDNFKLSFDSLRVSNDSIIYYLESQIDSFRLEQSMLIGPEFSNNIIKLYNKVNILEDRAFFMDSLYFGLVTDMVIIENQISSIINSIEEMETIDNNYKSNIINSNNPIIDYNYEYKVAHRLYMTGEYDSSVDKFKFLLASNISNDLADNCQFWIGQIYFLKNDYQNAIKEFGYVLKYKNSNKKEDSIYKMGLCYMKINQNNKAIESFQTIIDDYPKSKYFNKAYDFILNLK